MQLFLYVSMLAKEIDRIRRMDQLIRLCNTGNATEFAMKLGVSRKHVYNLMDSLRELGVEIKYNRQKQSFVYAKNYKIEISIQVKTID